MIDIKSFIPFMQKMKGKNPTDIINELMSKGKITQEQLNIAQTQANEMKNQFETFKQMFGFN